MIKIIFHFPADSKEQNETVKSVSKIESAVEILTIESDNENEENNDKKKKDDQVSTVESEQMSNIEEQFANEIKIIKIEQENLDQLDNNDDDRYVESEKSIENLSRKEVNFLFFTPFFFNQDSSSIGIMCLCHRDNNYFNRTNW